MKAGELSNGDVMAPERVLAAVIIHGQVVADGVASSARYAKTKACEKALDKLDGVPPFKFRDRYGCDCKVDEKGAQQGAEVQEEVA